MPVTFLIGARRKPSINRALNPLDLGWLCRRSGCRKNRDDRSGQNRNDPVQHGRTRSEPLVNYTLQVEGIFRNQREREPPQRTVMGIIPKDRAACRGG
jgi:hypothetical protein